MNISVRISLYTVFLSILAPLFKGCSIKGQKSCHHFLSEVLYFPKNCATDSLGENGQVLSSPKERVSNRVRACVAALF